MKWLYLKKYNVNELSTGQKAFKMRRNELKIIQLFRFERNLFEEFGCKEIKHCEIVIGVGHNESLE